MTLRAGLLKNSPHRNNLLPRRPHAQHRISGARLDCAHDAFDG